MGQGTPSQSSQWLQGAFAVSRAVTGELDGTAAAATVEKPPAKMARQLRTAARARKRFMGEYSSAQGRIGQSRARHVRFDNAGKIVNR